MSRKPVAAGKSSFDLIDPSAFFAHVEIDPGGRILDAACWVGRYSIEISRRLDEKGVIHAVDLWDEGIEILKKTIAERHISNIHPIRADITKHIPVEGESIDFGLMATILHDLSPEEQDRTLREMVRVLKPGGVLAVIEFKKIREGPGPPIAIRMSEQETEAKITKYGFLKTYQGEIGEFNYLMNFRKTG